MGYKSNYVNDLFTNTLARPFFLAPIATWHTDTDIPHTLVQKLTKNMQIRSVFVIIFVFVADVFFRLVPLRKCACHFGWWAIIFTYHHTTLVLFVQCHVDKRSMSIWRDNNEIAGEILPFPEKKNGLSIQIIVAYGRYGKRRTSTVSNIQRNILVLKFN